MNGALRPVAVITGASAGIGVALARVSRVKGISLRWSRAAKTGCARSPTRSRRKVRAGRS